MYTTIRRWLAVLGLTVTGIASIPVLALLASCASSGIYDMSDEWCARHADASPAHCPENQRARAADGNPTLTVTSDTRRMRSEPDADPQG
jgi:hypothetical protein